MLAGEHLTPEFRKLNPQHTIPLLIDDGVPLWDSHAIIIYLVSKYGKPNDSLYPNDLVTRSRINQNLHFDSGVLFARLRFLFEPILYYGSTDLPQEKIDNIYKAYDLLESVLQETPYLVGSSLTLADLSCISSVSSLQGLYPITTEKYPKLNCWIKRLEQLPYYTKVNKEGAVTLQNVFKEQLAKNKAAK